jgi:hypothetical protein
MILDDADEHVAGPPQHFFAGRFLRRVKRQARSAAAQQQQHARNRRPHSCSTPPRIWRFLRPSLMGVKRRLGRVRAWLLLLVNHLERIEARDGWRGVESCARGPDGRGGSSHLFARKRESNG